MDRTSPSFRYVLIAACAGLAFGASAVLAQPSTSVTGAIYTTYWDVAKQQWDVNHNIYPAKDTVFLTGGPPKGQDPGLGPDGDYYYQVTNPNGEVLLSTDPVECRRVTIAGGRLVATVPATVGNPPIACQHKLATELGFPIDSNGNNPVQLIPFDDTPNPGGEYKAWMTPVALYDATGSTCWREKDGGGTSGYHGFCNDYSKTDNFKIRLPGSAYIQACKFWDHNGNGVRDDGDQLLSGWQIAASYGDTTAPQTTDDSGCTTFTFLPPLPETVSFVETEQTGWLRTTEKTVTAVPDATTDQTVYFGNYNLYEDEALTVDKTALPSVRFKWTIDKVANNPLLSSANPTASFSYTVNVSHDDGTYKVSGKITVSSTLSVDAPGLKLTDSAGAGSTCVLDPDASNFTVLAKDRSYFDYVCTFTGAVATGNNVVTLSDQSDVEIASFSKPFDFKDADIIDGEVTVTDDKAPNPPLPATIDVLGDNPTVFKYSIDWTGTPGTCKTFDNTATFTSTMGNPPATGSDIETVKLCVGADLVVSKTATPSYTRTYNWSISKLADKTLVEQFGGSATFNYTVKVEQSGFTDSNWQVTGVITVSNPNDWEAIVPTSVTDVLPGATCTVGALPASIAAKASVDVSYTCSFSSKPAYDTDLTNTATATWNASDAYTPNGSASGGAKLKFTTPTATVNKTIHVTDSYAGSLGMVTASDSTPYASATFTYSRTVTVPAWDCVTYDNTATITETGQAAQQSVEVCGPAKTGALTMGFWSNKNGQAIITGGASTGGVCNSGTWLRQYAPFQDLGSSATCAQVGTYFMGVKTSADASGASMNAMLKAQMLATALDVYFSNAALGGNKINAPAPIGGVSVDLKKICTDLSCKAFEDSSSVFGGSPRTVLQMLSYAASQSNVGGSTWYGNVKPTQELAKDAFDAINNQKVFAP